MRSYQVVELGHTLRDAAPRSHAVTAIGAQQPLGVTAQILSVMLWGSLDRGPLRADLCGSRMMLEGRIWAGHLLSPVVSGDCWITRVFAAKTSDSVHYDKCNIAPAASPLLRMRPQ